MPKLYCVSDIHGYSKELKIALDEAGFDPNDENSWLITLGDHFDRGPDPMGVMNYLQSLPRKIFICGNHESLIFKCITRQYPEPYDWHNGTVQTIVDLAPEAQTFEEACNVAYEKIKDFIGSMVNYYETEHYVFTHGYLPVNNIKDWRNAADRERENALWLNSMEMAHTGYTIDKCVIAGHFHTSWGRHVFEGKPEFGMDADFSPYYYKDELIAIDGCITYSGKCNVLVLEDEFLEE